jgi:hypothetical protein
MRIDTPLTDTLTRQIKRTDSRPGHWLEPVNPDGEKAAEYIRQTLVHVGYITYLALNHIEDEKVKAEIARRAHLIMEGAKQ